MVQTEKLILLRKKNGFTQIKAAEKLQVSRQAISGWETGAVLPSLENLKSLSNLYGVSVDYLLNESPTETAPMEAENRVEVQTHSANIKRMLICSITVIAIVILISISITPGRPLRCGPFWKIPSISGRWYRANAEHPTIRSSR